MLEDAPYIDVNTAITGDRNATPGVSGDDKMA